ncbi:MAG: NCS2 family permease [Prevotella sp.]|nr:NCS2 family permease [Prevotella sp.]
MTLFSIFGFDRRTMSVRKEMLGGITTFLTMAYILAINPSILHDAGMDQGAVFTSTAIASIVATLIMAIYAKLPFALAPGMGLNAFFAYTIVIAMGYTWQFALTAVLIEGLIFVILTVTGVRRQIIDAMPRMLQRAISPGLGLFIAFIGFKNAGIIVANDSTFLALGDLHSPVVLLACLGIVISAVLLIRGVIGALLIGIIITAIVGIPLGLTSLDGIFSLPPSITPVFCQFEWSNIFCADMGICVLTLLFFDMFDTLGTLIGVSNRAGMVDKNGNILHLNKALMADAVGTMAGAILGTSTVTTFAESAAGVNAGGRSGLTSFFTAVCFGLALCIAPLFLAIPSQATAPALILVGVMMMRDIREIDFCDFKVAIPCFVCITMMSLACSISDGILLGMITYVILHVCSGNWRNIRMGTYILVTLFILKYVFF